MMPKALDKLIRTINNKQSIIRMPANRTYKGINYYDVESLDTSKIDRYGYMSVQFYVGRVFMGLSATDIYAFDGGDLYEYILVQNDDGCVLLRSYCPMGIAYS